MARTPKSASQSTGPAADPATTDGTVLAEVIDALDHDGAPYSPGDLIELDQASFLALTRAGVVQPVDASEA
jgi:hypothetical protein